MAHDQLEESTASRPNVLLRQARLEKGFSQSQLATKLGVETQTVSSWERGTRFPLPQYRHSLCIILEKSPEQLDFQRDGEREVDPSSFLATPTTNALPPLQHIPFKRTNRERMLKRVHHYWIAGILQQSLYHEMLISLRLREQPDAIENPWRLAVQESNQPSRLLAEGTSIVEVYDEAHGELLLLGEPGAGKTTLLLELTRTLLERARLDETHPLPIVFHLSSWAQKRQELSEWLIEELHTRYRVPYKLGQSWVATDQILLLLDGLDEMAPLHRAACVETINRYRQQHGLVPIVVCSRSADYLALSNQLYLLTAVAIQPLSLDQITSYLEVDEQLRPLRTRVQYDLELQDLMSTPLMLSIWVLAYQGMSHQEILTLGSTTERQKQIFGMYVQRMLERRGARIDYAPQQTMYWLSWLARQLTAHSQTEFYLERMQPDWLPEHVRPRYQHMVIRLVYGLLLFVFAAGLACLRGGKAIDGVSGVGAGLLGWLGSGPGNTILGWMAPGLGGGLEGGGAIALLLSLVNTLILLLIGSTGPRTGWSWPRIQRGLRMGLTYGLTTTLISGLFISVLFRVSGGTSFALSHAIGFILFCGMLLALLSGLAAVLRYETAGQAGNQMHVTSHHIPKRRRIHQVVDGLMIGACAGLGFGMVDALVEPGQMTIYVYGAVIGFLTAVVFATKIGTHVIHRVGTEIQPAEIVAWSWKNVWSHLPETFNNGLLGGLVIAMMVFATFGTATSLFYGVAYGLAFGSVFALVCGLVVATTVILTRVMGTGWSSTILDERQLIHVNEGIQRSARNSLFAGCLLGPVGGIASGLASGLAFGMLGKLHGWLILGLGFAIVMTCIFALLFWLTQGGIAWIEHYMLRLFLWQSGQIPWNPVRFFDYAAERILLRKVGGGYMFAHRLLLDYFAALDTPANMHKPS